MEPISLFDPAVQADPYPTYRRLREQAPVYREPRFGTWVLTRFADVYGALRDHTTFSSAGGIAPGMRGQGGFVTMITTDPPRHTRLRALVNKAFTPRVVAELVPMMRRVVDELLADVDGGPVDMVETLTYPLPVIVIAQLLGIPPEERARFKRWSDAVVGVTDAGLREENQQAVVEMFQYFAAQIAARRAAETPGHDLITAVVRAEIDGEALSDGELLSFCLLLLVAGNETTTNLIGNLLNVLADRPDLWRALRADRTLVEPAVEEALRYDSPVQALWRTATRDVELHGTTIAKDERVMVVYAAANRDPEAFPDPDTFRLDRQLNRHVAFGHGIHYCLGAPLARAEAAVALGALLDRYTALERPAAPAERLPTSILRGFRRLPLQFHP
jgi:cytochrome P450